MEHRADRHCLTLRARRLYLLGEVTAGAALLAIVIGPAAALYLGWPIGWCALPGALLGGLAAHFHISAGDPIERAHAMRYGRTTGRADVAAPLR